MTLDKQFRGLIESINAGIVVIQKERIAYVNSHAAKRFGVPKSKLLGRNFLDFIPKDRWTQLQGRYKELLASNKKIKNFVVEIIDHKGILRTVQLNSAPAIFNSESARIVTVRDITKQRQTEADLRFQSELIKQSYESIITTDLDFKINWVNEAFIKLFGYSKKEVLGKTPDFLNAERLAADIQNEISTTIKNRGVYRGAHLVKKKNGSTFQCNMAIFPIYNENNEVFAYSGHLVDVTEEIETRNALISSEARFRSVFESIAEGVVLVDKRGKILFVNDSLCQLTAIGRKKIEGKNAMNVANKFIEVKQLPLVLKSIENVLQKTKFTPFEIMINNKTLRLSISYNKIDKSIIGVLRDITEEKRATNKLNNYRDHLEELVEQRTIELNEKNKELDYALKVFVGREVTIKNLQNQVDELRLELNKVS